MEARSKSNILWLVWLVFGSVLDILEPRGRGLGASFSDSSLGSGP